MALVHILNGKTDEIIGTLNSAKAEYWQAIRHDSIDAENTFDFIVNASIEKSSLLEKRNRLIVQDEDGYYREYIIIYAGQYKQNEKDVRSNASFADLAKAKVIEPQTLTGATSSTAVTFALDGTEWTPGDIEYTSIRSITIDDYTNPLSFLKTIASTFDLEISYRIVVEGNQIVGRYVDMKKQIAGFEGKEITFGKDLVGVKRKEDSNQIVTTLLGIGPEKDDGTRLTVLVSDDDAFQRWARNGQHLIEPYEPESTDQDMTLDRLQELTENELKKRINAIVEYECDAVSLEHIFGREHEKIRIGQTVRIKDDGYQPPLYVEGRIQEVDVDQATHQIKSFKIGNFVEFKKSDLENQIKWLKDLLAQKASQTFVQNYAEKKKVLSETPPEDTAVIWVKPDQEKNVNIAHTFDGADWVPITTTNAGDITEGEMLFDRLRGGVMIVGGSTDGVLEVKDSSDLTHTTINKDGIDTNQITIRRASDGYAVINNGQVNFDFNIDAHEPPFMDGGIDVYGYWYRGFNYNWANCNFFNYRHTARYLKIQMQAGVGDNGVGWVRIMDRDGATKLWELSHSYAFSVGGASVVATIDLGTPTGDLKAFYIQLATSNTNIPAYVRVVRKWLEG